MRYAVILLVPLLALLAACGGGGEEAQPTPTPSPAVIRPSPTLEPTPEPTLAPTPTAIPEPAVQRIAYIGPPNGNLWIMSADGVDQTRLTDIPAGDGVRAWAPDGTSIVFFVCEPNPSGMGVCLDRIYIVNTDGSGLTLLAERVATDLDWSPEGTRIAFADRTGIYRMNPDGSNVTLISGIPASRLDWSPDGTRIAFASADPGGNSDIYVMSADGSDATRLTDNPGRDDGPAWTPDGARIGFTSYGDGNLDIYVMNADGSGVVRLTDHPARDELSSWSPAGSRILYVSDRDAAPYVDSVYVMNSDGSGQVRLTDNPAGDRGPAWSPDGTRIAFARCQPEGTIAPCVPSRIYVMNADGSDLTPLTEGYWPAWQPQP